jgi:predicted anti-sigma-YlaC factor YlaD
MNDSNCRVWVCELVECARARVVPTSELRQHLRECPECAARWASEGNLNTHLQVLKEATAARQPAQAQRERIMRQFALTRRRMLQPALRWALAVAAALVLTVGVGSIWRGGGWGVGPGLRPAGSTAGAGAGADSAEAEAPEASEGFVAVPYAAPLAPGEFVRVVHAELGSVELARMGVFIDDFDAGEVPADVVVGEDGFPRAVRVWDDSQF